MKNGKIIYQGLNKKSNFVYDYSVTDKFYILSGGKLGKDQSKIPHEKMHELIEMGLYRIKGE